MRTRNTVLLLVLGLILVACHNGTSSSATRTATPSSTASPVTTGTATAIEPSPTGASSASVGVHCGTERWLVKTLSDSNAGLVNFVPVPETVAQLRALPKPASLPDASRIGPTELTEFTVAAQLVEFKQEDDRDIHLVIADPADASQTMIVEFPDAQDCSGAVGSTHAQEMRAARAAFEAAFGQPPTSQFKHISGTATVTGVGFFDFLHGQTGVAPNGIELHPVLSFSVQGSAAPLPQPTAAAPAVLPGQQPAVPAGATAICNDGTYSYSQHRRGTCSHHGGVATWLVDLPP